MVFTFVHPSSACGDQYYNLTVGHNDLSKRRRFSKGWHNFNVDARLVERDVLKFVICHSDEAIVYIILYK